MIHQTVKELDANNHFLYNDKGYNSVINYRICPLTILIETLLVQRHIQTFQCYIEWLENLVTHSTKNSTVITKQTHDVIRTSYSRGYEDMTSYIYVSTTLFVRYGPAGQVYLINRTTNNLSIDKTDNKVVHAIFVSKTTTSPNRIIRRKRKNTCRWMFIFFLLVVPTPNENHRNIGSYAS